MSWYKKSDNSLAVPGQWIVVNDSIIARTTGNMKSKGKRTYMSAQVLGSGCPTCEESDFKIPTWFPTDQKIDIYESLESAKLKAME
tara:strand:+ start:375 stop:632 length:258 start_codon:yes stop_codon:yes gene_type:complete